jgi:hypothetical protein
MIDPTLQDDLISETEARSLLGGVSKKTLQRYRGTWVEGVHFIQGRPCQYIKPMVLDWLLHRHDPAAHNRAMDQWYKDRTYQRRKRA